MQSSQIVQQFFSAFGRGDLDALVSSFAPNARIIAVRAGERRRGELYGTYEGERGVREFIANLGATFDTQAFTVDVLAGEGEVAFAKGAFSHVVKRTGRTYRSDWALMCRVREGRIVEYRFFEDSAALAVADPTTALVD